MHVPEANLLGCHLEGLRDPSSEPTWPQKGIARYCYRVPDYAGALKKQKARGTKIYVEDQRGMKLISMKELEIDRTSRLSRMGRYTMVFRRGF